MTGRYKSFDNVIGSAGMQLINNSKILVVGAGGIGCELLKNLALSGFQDIEVIDLDTIDVSNLNRQFLFRPEHVGESKAKVAADAVRKFNPSVKIVAHHGNIKDSQYGISYFQSFDIVLNALDNIDARKHVNRICLASDVPLIDAGTTGYLGQVMPIFKGVTECYECQPKPTPKTYPICTIRSTPDKPVHCIVWAKECFKLLFGNQVESMLYEDPASGETSTYMHLVAFPSFDTLDSSSFIERIVTYAVTLLEALFHTEIIKRIEMGTYKTAKSIPQPISKETIHAGSICALDYLQHANKGNSTYSRPSQGQGWDNKVWNDVECITEWIICIFELLHHSPQLVGQLEFDKDQDIIMKYVYCTSNLRMSIFHIDKVSYHDCKGIAGNIIPAIATTNAIVAGLQVSQAIKYLTKYSPKALALNSTTSSSTHTGTTSTSSTSTETTTTPTGTGIGFQHVCMKDFPYTYCVRMPNRRGLLLQPSEVEPPQNTCFVCQTSKILLQIDTEKTTLEKVVTKVIKARLGFNEPCVLLGSSTIYEEGEDADDYLQKNLSKYLSQCPAGGIHDDTILTIVDNNQNLTLNIVVKHRSQESFEKVKNETVAADQFIISGYNATTMSSTAQETSHSSSSTHSSQLQQVTDESIIQNVDDGFEVVESLEVHVPSTTTTAPVDTSIPLRTSDTLNEASATVKKRGRPSGSKGKPRQKDSNTSSVIVNELGSDKAEVQDVVTHDVVNGKKKGRPSKEKLEKVITAKSDDVTTPKKRGRPLGSIGKYKNIVPSHLVNDEYPMDNSIADNIGHDFILDKRKPRGPYKKKSKALSDIPLEFTSSEFNGTVEFTLSNASVEVGSTKNIMPSSIDVHKSEARSSSHIDTSNEVNDENSTGVENGLTPTSAKKRGRPLGSKGKIKEKNNTVVTDIASSHDRTISIDESVLPEEISTTPKKRGRPLGSKNKMLSSPLENAIQTNSSDSTTDVAVAVAVSGESSESMTKKKRGPYRKRARLSPAQSQSENIVVVEEVEILDSHTTPQEIASRNTMNGTTNINIDDESNQAQSTIKDGRVRYTPKRLDVSTQIDMEGLEGLEGGNTVVVSPHKNINDIVSTPLKKRGRPKKLIDTIMTSSSSIVHNQGSTILSHHHSSLSSSSSSAVVVSDIVKTPIKKRGRPPNSSSNNTPKSNAESEKSIATFEDGVYEYHEVTAVTESTSSKRRLGPGRPKKSDISNTNALVHENTTEHNNFTSTLLSEEITSSMPTKKRGRPKKQM